MSSSQASPPRPRTTVVALLTVLPLVLLASCTAGDPQFSADAPAGFWMGLWHGAIAPLALIVGIFSEGVQVYERSNTGGWYDFGLIFGLLTFWGGGSHTASRRASRRARRRSDHEWEEIGRKVEAKLQRKIRAWAGADPDENWDLVEAKAEAKLKLKLREWAEDPAIEVSARPSSPT